jgi:hypothetical protein
VNTVMRALACAATFGLPLGANARAEDLATYTLTLSQHRFTPVELRVPAGQAFYVTVKNLDDSADEFEMHAPAIEKVILPGSEGKVRIRPLGPGRFPFMGDFHSDTAQGVIISQ